MPEGMTTCSLLIDSGLPHSNLKGFSYHEGMQMMATYLSC
jgi:hypothetical protein